MNIIVCIKQVPGTSRVEIDPETGVLKRDGVSGKMNPYDLYALETALRIKEQNGAHVAVITMGPPQAETVIREAYMMGADAGYLLSDRRFAGSDVLATSYTLAGGIRRMGPYDLILCGKQTTDGDTAQVGPALAEQLAIPHATWIKAIESIDGKGLVALQNMEDSYAVVRLAFPCLLSIEKDIYTPRLPSYLNLKKTKDRPISLLTLGDLADPCENSYGLSGSPTQVERIFQPAYDIDRILWSSAETDCAARLFDLLAYEKFI